MPNSHAPDSTKRAAKLALEEAPSAAAALELRGGLRLGRMVEADLESFVVHGVEEAVDFIAGALGGGGVEEARVDEALGDSFLAGMCLLAPETPEVGEPVFNSLPARRDRANR
eukprot:jgi/Tetstr1/448863/TSEL_036089.t1